MPSVWFMIIISKNISDIAATDSDFSLSLSLFLASFPFHSIDFFEVTTQICVLKLQNYFSWNACVKWMADNNE